MSFLRSKWTLKKNSAFQNIFTNGRKLNSFYFTLYYFKQEISQWQIGVCVSKKIKLKVEKNLIKRQTSWIIREFLKKYQNLTCFSFVVVVKGCFLWLSFSQKKKVLSSLLKRMIVGEKH